MLEETLAGGAGKAPVVEDEATRLQRLHDEQIATRNANTKTRPGAGAADGLSIPAVVAEKGKPVVTKLAEAGQLPAKEIPPGAPL